MRWNDEKTDALWTKSTFRLDDNCEWRVYAFRKVIKIWYDWIVCACACDWKDNQGVWNIVLLAEVSPEKQSLFKIRQLKPFDRKQDDGHSNFTVNYTQLVILWNGMTESNDERTNWCNLYLIIFDFICSQFATTFRRRGRDHWMHCRSYRAWH